MNSFIDIVSDIAKVFAAINILAATYFHYRYVFGPSSSKNLRSAELHCYLSGFSVALAALTDDSLSTIMTIVIVLSALTIVIVLSTLIAPDVPNAYIRKTRTQRTPTFLDHTTLRRQLRSNYTDENIQKYMNHARHYNQLRITLHTLSAYALGVVAVITAAYNVLHIWNGNSNQISILELAFPFLATAFATHLHHTNKNLNTKYISDAIEDVNNAKHINELMNRNRR